MNRSWSFPPRRLSAFTLFLVVSSSAGAQVRTTARPAVRITQAVDDRSTTTLAGTHPDVVSRAAIGERVDPATPMHHIRLVLSSSGDQELALRALLVQQQDKTSPNYHQWLTPDTFGTYFGAAPSDIAKITSWLEARGFAVEGIARGGRIIDFGGNAGQVETVFHTQLNHITVDGEAHISNTTDISVPTALSTVIQGIASLNDFAPRAHATNPGRAYVATPVNRSMAYPQPQLTLPSTGYHYVAPGDAAVIFNSAPLLAAGLDGTGQTIAVLGRSDINLSDVQQFRSMFGLKKNDPAITILGTDPGLNSDDDEAYLDVEWSGSMAPGAAVDFIVGGTDYFNTGGISSAGLYAVDNNIGDIISLSYYGCETNDGASVTAFWNNLWEQAAAQGQSVFVCSGDSGATGCASKSGSYGTAYSVNALGSSAYNVAVGGSMFVDYGPSQYWSAGTGATPFTSALSYIPEAALNQGTLSTTYLNGASTGTLTGSGIFSTGGGISIYTARPAWQTGSGISATSDPAAVSGTGIAPGSPITGPHRLVPDVVSLSSAHDPATFCAEGVCADNSTGYSFGTESGTSVATPMLASVQALINQKNGGRQGNPNFFYYPLANADYTSGVCQAPTGTSSSPTVTPPASTCNFHDIIAGSNIVQQNATDTVGLGFLAARGFDAASGLGSLNVANVASNWSSVTVRATAATFTLSPTNGLTHGAAQLLSVNVAPASGTGTPTGDVSLIAETANAGDMLRYTLKGGVYSGSIAGLPGGNYNVHVHYEGDGTFAASDSASIPVSIGKENSSIAIAVDDFYPGFYQTNVSTIPYGYLTELLSTASGTSKTGTPSGAMSYAITDNGNSLAGLTNTVDSVGSTALIAGASYTNLYIAPNYPALSPGSYTVTVSYSGDSSFNPTSSTAGFTVAKLTPGGALTASSSYIASGASVTLNYTVAQLTASYFPTLAAYPTGTVQFSDLTTNTILGTTNLSSTGIATLSTSAIASSGAHTIYAYYLGDSNYAAINNSGTVTVGSPLSTSTQLTATNGTVYVGSTIALTATVNPAVSGAVSFYDGQTLLGTAISTGSGIAIFSTTALAAGAHTLSATFAGTTTYAASTGTTSLTVNKNNTSLYMEAPVASTYGQTIAMNGRISRSPSVTTPAVGLTGSVTFYDGGAVLGSATPVYTIGYGFFTATFSLQTVTAGTHTLSAIYSGDANYASAGSAYVTSVVAKETPALSLSTPSTVVSGANGSASLTATLGIASVLASPTAQISFYNGGTLLGSVTPTYSPGAGGYVATYTATGLTSGAMTLSATYPGDSNYNTVSANLGILVTTNNIWVANGNGSVSALAEAGTALTSSAVTGGGKAIAIDAGGDVWSLNQGGGSVAEFSKTGAVIAAGYSGGGLSSATALAFDGSGTLWIANGNSTVSVFSSAGTPVSSTAYSTPTATPTSLNVDGSGNVWITNAGNNSVTEMIGVASPVTTPLTTAVKNSTLATEP